ncbi:hypothetical protein EFD56_24230 [Rhizobium phaseoli]|nr:hypothetical protein EFD56_24230 [Rhizobium phaseoli]
MLVHNDKGVKLQSNTGRYAPDLLCGKCDGILGKYEESALALLKQLRLVKIGTKTGTTSHINSGTYRFRVEKVDDFVRFACGILWKYASLPEDNPSVIKVGHFRESLELVCFHDAPVPSTIDVFLERDLLSVSAFDDPHDVFYYVTPSVDVVDDRRMIWFSVGGFIIYVKLDNGEPSDFAPSVCWMRGRKKCHFNVSMRALHTNTGIVESIHTARDDLARLNRKILLPQRGVR